MPWWGWMLVGAGTAGLITLAIWLLLRRKAVPAVDRIGLIDSERTRLEAERDAEAAARAAAEKVAANLEAEIRDIAQWKQKQLEVLDAEKARNYRDMAGDPDAILRRLDEILGPAKPGG
jgi:hypothetical protein